MRSHIRVGALRGILPSAAAVATAAVVCSLAGCTTGPTTSELAAEVAQRTPVGSPASRIGSDLDSQRVTHSNLTTLRVDRATIGVDVPDAQHEAEVGGAIVGDRRRALIPVRQDSGSIARTLADRVEVRFITAKLRSTWARGFRAGLYATYFFDARDQLVYVVIERGVNAP